VSFRGVSGSWRVDRAGAARAAGLRCFERGRVMLAAVGGVEVDVGGYLGAAGES
jgi:hypothetical protein